MTAGASLAQQIQGWLAWPGNIGKALASTGAGLSQPSCSSPRELKVTAGAWCRNDLNWGVTLNAKILFKMNLQTSSCGSACWALVPSRLPCPCLHCHSLLSSAASQGPPRPAGLRTRRSPCLTLVQSDDVINSLLFYLDCGGSGVWFFLRPALLEEGYPPHNSAWPSSLPLWITLPSVQCRSHCSTFLRRQMFLISLLDVKDFYPAEGLSSPHFEGSASHAGMQRHGVVSAPSLSRKLIKVGVGGSTLKQNLSRSTEGMTLKTAALGGKQPYYAWY